MQKPASRLHWLVPKQPNSSRNRAQHAFPAQRPESLTSRTDALKKNKAYATPTYCKNQLQDSIGWFRNSRTPAGIVAQHAFPAQRPESLTSRTDALKNKAYATPTYCKNQLQERLHWLVPKQPNTSRNRAQHAFPAQRPESLTLRTDALKKTKLMPHLPIAKTSFKKDSIGWFRNSRTPAGIVPNMPSQHSAPNL